jgi:hypothetical protein
MGLTGSKWNCLEGGWPLSDNIQERVTALEQKNIRLDTMQHTIDTNHDSLDQRIQSLNSDIKHTLIRMEKLEHRMTMMVFEQQDNDLVILKSS